MSPALVTAGGAVLAAGAAAVGAAVGAEAFTYMKRRREIEALRTSCARDRVLAITYDDGPGPVITPRLLDVLARSRAHATFFPLGRRVPRAPEVLDAVAAAGHEIGTHSFDHLNAYKSPPWAVLGDIAAGYATVAPWVAPDGRFRPPHGKQTTLSRAALRRRGAPVAWWTLDSGDTHAQLPEPQSVVERVRADGGGVVLLHDHDEQRPAERLDYVCDVTERLLHAAQADGLSVRRLREL